MVRGATDAVASYAVASAGKIAAKGVSGGVAT